MKQSLSEDKKASVLTRLSGANEDQAGQGMPSPWRRQPLHTVYGGAHLFADDTINKVKRIAQAGFAKYAKDASVLSEVFALEEALAEEVHQLVAAKLEGEAVEDYRVDFEDGYGNRSDEEEDRHAQSAARAMASQWTGGSVPPFVGLRIRPLVYDRYKRSTRTLDIFMSELLEATDGRLPENFTVTLPKVTSSAQVEALSLLLEELEAVHGLEKGKVTIEIMVESPDALVDRSGCLALPHLLRAAGARCRAVHFGAFDYTASLKITASEQSLAHPACDFARQIMKVCLARESVFLCDGATNTLPIAPHKNPASSKEERENQVAVHEAWQASFQHILSSLKNGFYQGWDLHPLQIPVRYVANYFFFRSGAKIAAQRLKNFMECAMQASLLGNVFDDAASAQGLLNFFLQALNCGALDENDLTATGLSKEELAVRSFPEIIKLRKY